MERRRQRAREPARGEAGFTIVEIVVALFVLAVGVLAVISTFDASRGLTAVAEKNEAATHVAERELERIQSLGYANVVLRDTDLPAQSTDPNSPLFYLDATNRTYRWDQRTTGAAPADGLAIDNARGMSADGGTWIDPDSRLHGHVYRFVTWVDDPTCLDLTCPGTHDYKRVTVAVTVDTASGIARGPKKPIVLSSVVSDPGASPINNPLTAASTRCLNGSGQLVECVAGIGNGVARTYFLYDQPSASNSCTIQSGQNHATHPTVAACEPPRCVHNIIPLLNDETKCPIPDLMDADPPAAPPTTPPLYDYSTDVSGGRAGGRALRRDVACNAAPTADNTKGEMWVTPAVPVAQVFNGNGGMTLYTQTIDGAAANVTMCVAVYDVPGSLLNLLFSTPTEIGRASYGPVSWPTSPGQVSFTFNFGAHTVALGNRIGVRIWPADSSGADVAVLYDHPTYPSSIQLNTTG